MSFRATVRDGKISLPPECVIPDGTEVEVSITKPADATGGGAGDYDENVDLSLIRENLRLTPTERARKAERARLQALALLEYGRKHRENTAGTNR